MRLIDADELLLNMANFYEFSNPETEMGLAKRKGLYLVKKIIQNEDITPTVDALEVVRCKDCKWYEKGKSYTPYCNNVKNLFEEMEPDDYCSYGKRREEE